MHEYAAVRLSAAELAAGENDCARGAVLRCRLQPTNSSPPWGPPSRALRPLSRSCRSALLSARNPRAAESGAHSAVQSVAVPDRALWAVRAVVIAGARAGYRWLDARRVPPLDPLWTD